MAKRKMIKHKRGGVTAKTTDGGYVFFYRLSVLDDEDIDGVQLSFADKDFNSQIVVFISNEEMVPVEKFFLGLPLSGQLADIYPGGRKQVEFPKKLKTKKV